MLPPAATFRRSCRCALAAGRGKGACVQRSKQSGSEICQALNSGGTSGGESGVTSKYRRLGLAEQRPIMCLNHFHGTSGGKSASQKNNSHAERRSAHKSYCVPTTDTDYSLILFSCLSAKTLAAQRTASYCPCPCSLEASHLEVVRVSTALSHRLDLVATGFLLRAALSWYCNDIQAPTSSSSVCQLVKLHGYAHTKVQGSQTQPNAAVDRKK
ncbi:hypothetical protein TgHK011_007503 [Trichoderma gracile]|nr:hypothetical protein TgHK011_007503 [Trichoderma gracile]